MYDLITIGDIKLDTFVVLDGNGQQCSLKMPEAKLCLDYGAKIDVQVVDSQIAGSAPNVAIGLARMKKKTAVLSVMGGHHSTSCPGSSCARTRRHVSHRSHQR